MLAALLLSVTPVALPDDGWVAMELPLVDDAGHIGCTTGDRVSLGAGNGTWIVRDEASAFERFTVYVKMDDGLPETVSAFTPGCEVTDASRAKPVALSPADAVTLIGGWLDAQLSRDVASRLVASVAHIDHASVNAVLEGEANDVSRDESAQDALFWLANRRGDPGREIVVRHLGEHWPLEHREQAVMALALSKHDAAWHHVRDVARNASDAELRAHAVTALGITGAPAALADLHSIFLSDGSLRVRRQAIFGISQVDSREAAEVLLDIARDPRHGELRRDALFWLANMDHEAGGELLDDLIRTTF